MAQVSDLVAALAILGPVVTGLGGYWLAGRNEEGRDRRTSDREEAVRRAALRERIYEERHNFQREVLIELQEVLRRFVRAHLKMIRHDVESLSKGQGITLLGQELDDESFEIQIELGQLSARLLDEALRSEIERLIEYSSSLEPTVMHLGGLSDQQILDALKAGERDLAFRAKPLFGHLGEILRAELGRIYELEQAYPKLEN